MGNWTLKQSKKAKHHIQNSLKLVSWLNLDYPTAIQPDCLKDFNSFPKDSTVTREIKIPPILQPAIMFWAAFTGQPDWWILPSITWKNQSAIWTPARLPDPPFSTFLIIWKKEDGSTIRVLLANIIFKKGIWKRQNSTLPNHSIWLLAMPEPLKTER